MAIEIGKTRWAELTDAEVAREMTWESIVRACEGGQALDVHLSREPQGWVATLDGVRAIVPEQYARVAEPPLSGGPRRLKVLRFDRALGILELRPILSGEPG